MEKNARYWRDYGQSPVWLWFYGTDATKAAWIRRALTRWESTSPPRLFRTRDNGLVVPLLLPLEAEREHSVSEVVRQIKEVGRLLEVAKDGGP